MSDTAKLILEVASHACLWNMNEKSYNDRDAKKKAWEAVAAAVDPDWDQGSTNDQKTKVDDLKKKWRHVKDYYKKDKKEQQSDKNGTPAFKRKKYVYSDLLCFLDQTMGRRRTQNNFLEEDSVDNSVDDDGKSNDDPQLISGNLQDEQNIVKVSFAKPQFTDKPSRTREKMNAYPSELIQFLTQKKKVVKTMEDEVDEDKYFLMSFIPALKKMSALQKIDFKIQMMQTLKSIQFPNLLPDVASRTMYPNSPMYVTMVQPTCTTPQNQCPPTQSPSGTLQSQSAPYVYHLTQSPSALSYTSSESS